MVFLTDRIGRTQQALYIFETVEFQPSTKDVIYSIIAVGYDGIRRTVLFTFFDYKEMHDKYLELHKEYMHQRLSEMDIPDKDFPNLEI